LGSAEPRSSVRFLRSRFTTCLLWVVSGRRPRVFCSFLSFRFLRKFSPPPSSRETGHWFLPLRKVFAGPVYHENKPEPFRFPCYLWCTGSGKFHAVLGIVHCRTRSLLKAGLSPVTPYPLEGNDQQCTFKSTCAADPGSDLSCLIHPIRDVHPESVPFFLYEIAVRYCHSVSKFGSGDFDWFVGFSASWFAMQRVTSTSGFDSWRCFLLELSPGAELSKTLTLFLRPGSVLFDLQSLFFIFFMFPIFFFLVWPPLPPPPRRSRLLEALCPPPSGARSLVKDFPLLTKTVFFSSGRIQMKRPFHLSWSRPSAHWRGFDSKPEC